jgi:hypothetical protein
MVAGAVCPRLREAELGYKTGIASDPAGITGLLGRMVFHQRFCNQTNRNITRDRLSKPNEDLMPTPDQDTKKPPIKEPEPDKQPVNIDPDDAMIQEPNDDAFKKVKKSDKIPH